MKQNWFFRILLSPLALLYGLGIGFRNFAYDVGLLKATAFSIPVISVGNLSIGGAGKTPHIEYLILLLRDYINLGTLSRGYKRKTKGFRWVKPQNQVFEVGDEPLQYARKFRDVVVAVDESRNTGIPQMIKYVPSLQTILLDDAFQHRSVTPGLNILLTSYALPYTRDYLMPSGRLREYRSAAERADVIIVTKCPYNLSKEERDRIIKDIQPLHYQKVFFSQYSYQNPYYLYHPSQKVDLSKIESVIVLTAIANEDYMVDYIEDKSNILQVIKYEDHHYFTEKEIDYVERVYEENKDSNPILVTTEKDAVRLDLFRERLLEKKIPLFVLPIKVEFLFNEEDTFNQDIKDFLLKFNR